MISHRPGKRRSYKQSVNSDLELRPLMNVFIVLIPMLLMSAVFMEIRTIEMSLPQAAEAAESDPAEPFDLAIRITPSVYVIGANGVAMHSIARAPGTLTPDPGTSAQISAALAGIVAAHPKHDEIRIVAESKTRYQEIVSVMDLARGAGLSRVALEGARIEGN
jgi:biopolymer transport protein ExbD